jgi:predicted nucleic acid-binding Zn ribbon protein
MTRAWLQLPSAAEELLLCSESLTLANEREREDARFHRLVRAARRYLDRARACYGTPEPHRRKARLVRQAMEDCDEATAALEARLDVRLVTRLVRAAERSTGRAAQCSEEARP